MWPVLHPLEKLLWPAALVLESPVQPSFPFTELARVANEEQGSRGALGFGLLLNNFFAQEWDMRHVTVVHRNPTRGSKEAGAELWSLMTSDKT